MRSLCAEVRALRTENKELKRTASRAEHFETKYKKYKRKAANGAHYKRIAKRYRLMLNEVACHTAALTDNVAAAAENVKAAVQKGQLAKSDFTWDSDSTPETESEPEAKQKEGDDESSVFDWSDAEDYA